MVRKVYHHLTHSPEVVFFQELLHPGYPEVPWRASDDYKVRAIALYIACEVTKDEAKVAHLSLSLKSKMVRNKKGSKRSLRNVAQRKKK